jgi:hypothetical protein
MAWVFSFEPADDSYFKENSAQGLVNQEIAKTITAEIERLRLDRNTALAAAPVRGARL